MENMTIFNAVRSVPENAKKAIKGGRLQGMTDINPVWRLETLTKQFGACGIGWYYEITDKRLSEVSTGEIAAFVDISLYIKVDGEWSKPIQGTGGSKFIANEKSGPFVSDECYKMALTDAISVACKMLGIGADVYWEGGRDSKYGSPADDKPQAPPQLPPVLPPQVPPTLSNASGVIHVTPDQIKSLSAAYKGALLTKLLSANNITRIEDLPYTKATELLSALVARQAAKKAAETA